MREGGREGGKKLLDSAMILGAWVDYSVQRLATG